MEKDNTEWLRLLFDKDDWSEADRRRLLEYLDSTDDAAMRRLMEDRFREDMAVPPTHPDLEKRLLTLILEKIGPAGSEKVGPASSEKIEPAIHEKTELAENTARLIPMDGRKKSAEDGWKKRLVAGWKKGTEDRWKIRTMAGWKKWAVAAVLLLLAGKFVFDLVGHRPTLPKSATSASPTAVATDRPPGTQNAMLVLGDGTKIALDNAANGKLAQQGNTKIIKLNGQIAYADNGKNGDNGKDGDNGKHAGSEPLMNTISTARGNQYMLMLSDGTKVWLNAASYMRFPASFKGNERKVEIVGEAYFEIAKNPASPFKVVAGGGEIQVLGTSFNVNAYSDESSVKTTLLEGAVAVQKEKARLVLSPGQQAKFSPGVKSAREEKSNARDEKGKAYNEKSNAHDEKTMDLVKDVDTGHETAWKDGYFWFDNTDIYTLMRQVARWYDVEVEFKGDVSDDGFSGKVSRSVPLSKLLKVLEHYDIHFKWDGKKIIISP